MGILAAMTFVRFGLEPLVKLMRRLFVAPGSWEKSSEFYILREVGAILARVTCPAVKSCVHAAFHVLIEDCPG